MGMKLAIADIRVLNKFGSVDEFSNAFLLMNNIPIV